MTSEEFQTLVRRATAAFEALTPEQQEDHLRAQRESWVRGEMALSELVKKRYADDGVVYEDYASYCFD